MPPSETRIRAAGFSGSIPEDVMTSDDIVNAGRKTSAVTVRPDPGSSAEPPSGTSSAPVLPVVRIAPDEDTPE